jgi:peptidoglycan/xylan/chitin deacetylase (PgdA/CDA1 family)
MMMRGYNRLRQSARRLLGRQPGSLIILYHRVAEAGSDPCRLSVSPAHFKEHLEVLRRDCEPLSLSRLVASAGAKRRAPGVAITFDDGYADNLLQAKPALERFGFPATFFITSGRVGTDRELWWDELERLLLQPGSLPATLRLSGAGLKWDLGAGAHYAPEAQSEFARWSLLESRDPGPRQRIYRDLVGVFYNLPEREQDELLEGLRAAAGATARGRQTHLVMTAEQVRSASTGGLIEIGAHTITHPVLSAHPLAVQRAEIAGSKRRLEEILGQRVESFAYPYGTRAHYTSETVSAVREAGFSRACSNFGGLVGRHPDPLQLPRFMVMDWDGDEFARRLRRWARGEG